MADEKKSPLLRVAEIAAREETGAHPWNPNSQIRGTRLGAPTGLKRTAVNLFKIPPGKESFIYHSHRYEEEWMYILSGRGIAEIDGVEHEVGPGDFMGFATEPPVAHHIRNPYDAELVYLCGAENRPFEMADYPKLGKRMLRSEGAIEIVDVKSIKPFP